jgi:hypothetical protein
MLVANGFSGAESGAKAHAQRVKQDAARLAITGLDMSGGSGHEIFLSWRMALLASADAKSREKLLKILGTAVQIFRLLAMDRASHLVRMAAANPQGPAPKMSRTHTIVSRSVVTVSAFLVEFEVSA